MPNALNIRVDSRSVFAFIRVFRSRRFVVLSSAIRGLPLERVFPRQHR